MRALAWLWLGLALLLSAPSSDGSTPAADENIGCTLQQDFLAILANPANEKAAFLQSDFAKKTPVTALMGWLDQRVLNDPKFRRVLSGNWDDSGEVKSVSDLILDQAKQRGLTLQRGLFPKRLAIRRATHKGGVVEIKILNAFSPRPGTYASIVETGKIPTGKGYLLVGKGAYQPLEVLFDVYTDSSGSKKLGIPFVERDATMGWTHLWGVVDDQTSAGESPYLADARMYSLGLPSATTYAPLSRMGGASRPWQKIPYYSKKRTEAGKYGTGHLLWWTFWGWIEVDPYPY